MAIRILNCCLAALILCSLIPRLSAETLEEFRSQGEQAFREGDFGRAIEKYSWAIELDKEDPLSYFGRALARPDVEGKVQDFSRAIFLKPDFYQAYLERGEVLLLKKDLDSAAADFTRAIDLAQDQPLKLSRAKPFYWRGHVFYEKGDLSEALQDFSQALDLDPQNADAAFERGNIMAKLKKYPEAIADYTQALAAKPNHVQAYFNRGNMYALLDDYEKAIQSYSQALALTPNDYEILNNRGVARVYFGDLNGAKQDFLKVVSLDPQRSDVYNNLGQVALKQGDIQKAILYYDEALKYHPEADTFLNAAQAKYKGGDPDGARKVLSQALERNGQLKGAYVLLGQMAYDQQHWLSAIQSYMKAGPALLKDVGVLDQIGDCYIHLGDFSEALRFLNQALKLNPDHQSALFHRARALKENGQFAAAMKDYDHLLELDKTLATAWYNRANIAFSLGQVNEAVEGYTHAIENAPSYADAYYNRAVAKESLGDGKGAQEDYRLSKMASS